ncbi:hypothetical protein [Paraburkholderia aromaticivorans]|uniref:hypothetical protein n=1 Tax=Paraburkholderia aromaticivorans TaxID=2026199 RepID=UPI001455FF24|nr:hypothetical protein [Paraburkholderia aromaticivorans]
MIAAAGELAVPFTTAIPIGIGETRLERIQSLLDIQSVNRAVDGMDTLQEVIVQNFPVKPGTRMEGYLEPDFDDLSWITAVARLTLDPAISLQVPPNLSDKCYPSLLDAGININDRGWHLAGDLGFRQSGDTVGRHWGVERSDTIGRVTLRGTAGDIRGGC